MIWMPMRCGVITRGTSAWSSSPRAYTFPCFTSPAAFTIRSEVMKLSMPRLSFSPQRPQLPRLPHLPAPPRAPARSRACHPAGTAALAGQSRRRAARRTLRRPGTQKLRAETSGIAWHLLLATRLHHGASHESSPLGWRLAPNWTQYWIRRRSRSALYAAVLCSGLSMTRKLRPSASVVKDRDVLLAAFLCREASSQGDPRVWPEHPSGRHADPVQRPRRAGASFRSHSPITDGSRISRRRVVPRGRPGGWHHDPLTSFRAP